MVRQFAERMAKMTVRDRKKQLIGELVDKNADTKRGKKITAGCMAAIAISRILLSVYEIIYFSLLSVPLSFISYALALLGLFVIYMVSDGNNGITYLLTIAGAIRILYLFASQTPLLADGAAKTVYTVIAIFILTAQCILSVVPALNKSCVSYSHAMQKVNLRVQGELTDSHRR